MTPRPVAPAPVGTPDLATLLADPARALDVPADAIAPALAEVTAHEARLGAVKVILAARLAAVSASTGTAHAGELVEDVQEVADIVRHSESWVRKNGHRLPGFSQPGGKGTRVAWDRAALVAWANGGGP
jgi:hypothetical protein